MWEYDERSLDSNSCTYQLLHGESLSPAFPSPSINLCFNSHSYFSNDIGLQIDDRQTLNLSYNSITARVSQADWKEDKINKALHLRSFSWGEREGKIHCILPSQDPHLTTYHWLYVFWSYKIRISPLIGRAKLITV